MERKIIYHETERSTGIFDIYADGKLVGRISECWPNNQRCWRVIGSDLRYASPQEAAKSLIKKGLP